MSCISQNPVMQHIIRSLSLTKDLYVSSILIGEKYTGKHTLVRQLFPEHHWVDGTYQNEVEEALKNSNTLIIENFEKLKNPDILDFNSHHIVALAEYNNNNRTIDEKFAFIYYVPSLKERPEDIKLFTKHYQTEAEKIYQIDGDKEIELHPHDIDISKNLKSLKASVYRAVALKTASKDELSDALYYYFVKNLSGDNAYREQLEIFDKAILKAGLELYKSQLKLANILGINRNTLRKKLHEYSIS